MREPPLLRVEWVDSVFAKNEWADAKDLTADTKSIVTVGFRVKEEDGYLFLASTFNPDDTHKDFALILEIPVRAIVKKKRIGH
ncbi:hypothetical protein LCGC14_0792920 [marine sediment metagenome]|uniref:Uncharacterized protein n=1 Tax=marine sediment metagenome TaxID=412755 RepID=A0A0F9QBT6_9ZZZZ